jgi:hypothetical protein
VYPERVRSNVDPAAVVVYPSVSPGASIRDIDPLMGWLVVVAEKSVPFTLRVQLLGAVSGLEVHQLTVTD